jgi:hypothetical protein
MAVSSGPVHGAAGSGPHAVSPIGGCSSAGAAILQLPVPAPAISGVGEVRRAQRWGCAVAAAGVVPSRGRVGDGGLGAQLAAGGRPSAIGLRRRPVPTDDDARLRCCGHHQRRAHPCRVRGIRRSRASAGPPATCDANAEAECCRCGRQRQQSRTARTSWCSAHDGGAAGGGRCVGRRQGCH